jgi:hypothetical protein
MVIVAAFGSAGGFLGWLASLLVQPTAERVWYLPLLSLLLGAGAALVFVFVIANTDRADRQRLWTLALLAGFFWEPVWEGARAFVIREIEEEAIARVETALEQAADLATRAAETRDLAARQALLREMNGEIARAAVETESIDTPSGRTRAQAAAARLAVSLAALPPEDRTVAAELWERNLRRRGELERALSVPDDFRGSSISPEREPGASPGGPRG